MITSLPVTTIAARDPRQEAREVAGPGYDPRVLEPSPPAVTEPPWWADDPVDPTTQEPGGLVLSPVAGLGDLTWSRWASADSPAPGPWLRDRWLARFQRLPRPPAGYAAVRSALHRLAVYVLSPARQRASDGKMALRWTRGGFGTPFYGASEQVRIQGTSLIRQRDGRAWTMPITTLAEAAAFVLEDAPATAWATGLDVPSVGDIHADLDIDPRVAAFIGAWYGFAWSVLEEVRADADSVDASRVQLWPEHFDAAFECLEGARRAGFGMSPGDAAHGHPYAYVTLWHPDEVPDDPHWNADTFRGAILPLADFVTAHDQRRTVIEFFRAHRRLLCAAPLE